MSAGHLRRLFNHGGFLQRVQAGSLQERIVQDRHPSAPAAPVPFCTRSQLVEYTDAVGFPVALVHQYLQPDGTLGASGLPDPKWVFRDGIIYRLRKRFRRRP